MKVDKNMLSDIQDYLILLKLKFDYIFPAQKTAPSWAQNPFLVNGGGGGETSRRTARSEGIWSCRDDVQRKQTD